MASNPRVTIGIPVYNGEKYVAAAIDSLLKQTYANFELVISDNASTDGTEQLCRHFVAADARVRYIRQPENVGAIANFNLLVAEAKGEYFKWAAHDDVCAPDYLERCVQALDERPDLAWCHCDSDMIDAAGDSWLGRMPDDDEEVEVTDDGGRQWAGLPRINHDHPRPSKRFAGVLLGTRWCVDSYGLIRKTSLQKTQLYLSVYGSEKVLIGQLSLIGKTHQVPKLMFHQRVHPDASCCQTGLAAQREFAVADRHRLFASTRLTLFFAHWRVIRLAEISSWEKICCYVVLARYLMQFRKWMRVIASVGLRRGVGGGGNRIMETGARHAPVN